MSVRTHLRWMTEFLGAGELRSRERTNIGVVVISRKIFERLQCMYVGPAHEVELQVERWEHTVG